MNEDHSFKQKTRNKSGKMIFVTKIEKIVLQNGRIRRIVCHSVRYLQPVTPDAQDRKGKKAMRNSGILFES